MYMGAKEKCTIIKILPFYERHSGRIQDDDEKHI